MAGPLHPDQIAAFRRDGFLCPVAIFSPAEAADLRAAYETDERTAPADLPRPARNYFLASPHLVMETPRRIATDPRILDVVESLLGPDLLLWDTAYFTKEPGSEKVVTWHQDLTYWGMGETDQQVTVWVALSPATAASGCMRFVPGSQKTALQPHRETFADDNILSRGQEIAVEVDEADAVTAALEPGQVSIHHGQVFHASGPNRSDDRRIGLVLNYIRPDTPTTGRGQDSAMLVRGIDRHQNRLNVMPSAGDFAPSALALYDAVLGMQAEIMMDGAAQNDGRYALA
ncbi:MAG: phytanoyl-CoA dioxygenase family protein [Pseudomonadota bacterium]